MAASIALTMVQKAPIDSIDSAAIAVDGVAAAAELDAAVAMAKLDRLVLDLVEVVEVELVLVEVGSSVAVA
jgi:hypothetical protein